MLRSYRLCRCEHEGRVGLRGDVPVGAGLSERAVSCGGELVGEVEATDASRSKLAAFDELAAEVAVSDAVAGVEVVSVHGGVDGRAWVDGEEAVLGRDVDEDRVSRVVIRVEWNSGELVEIVALAGEWDVQGDCELVVACQESSWQLE